jgi:hypothetical protein
MAGEETKGGGGTAPTPDIEDWGAVAVNERCCGAASCRVLAPEIFLQARAGAKTNVSDMD